jgi:hypothetical protein
MRERRGGNKRKFPSSLAVCDTSQQSVMEARYYEMFLPPRLFCCAEPSVASYVRTVGLLMGYRSWLVRIPNVVKSTETLWRVCRLDPAPVGVCADGSNARMRLRSGQIRNTCIHACHGVIRPHRERNMRSCKGFGTHNSTFRRGMSALGGRVPARFG